jgi:hypothetical protein
MAEKVTVKSGQTLSSIAKANNTTVAAIKEANPVLASNPKYQGGNVIFSGTKLTIPTTTPIVNPYNTTGPFNPQGGVGTGTYGPSSTPSAATSQFPAAGTVISSSSVDNGDGTFTVTTIYADGKGGTYQNVTQSGVKKDVKKDQEDKANKDAYALLEDTLNTYGLSSLASVIKGYMLAGLGPEQAKLQIKQDPIYKARFRGNELRLTAGLNALSEAEYLGLEDTYSQVMNQYGLGDYFGTTKSARQTKLADIIGGDISAVELKSRISTVVDRVNNADPGIKAQLKEFYPGITETDLVKYFLDPKQTLPQLQEKVTSAEIGAAATGQGLKTSMTSASDLARYGIDRAAAVKGYATIGGILPEATKLSGIYGEAKIDYTQATAEQEVFKGNASAERKRKQLAALESAQFSGSAGVGSAGLSTQMLRKSSSGGQF